MAGCGQLEAPTAPAAQPFLGRAINGLGITGQELSATLLLCSPLPAEKVTQTVGPSGGTIQAGQHRLVIPPGALADTVTITAQVPNERVNSIRFAPEGLTFATPALLTMSYANCGLAVLLPKRIVYTAEDLSLLEILQSFDNVFQQTVSAPLDHFSRYAVAW